MKSKQISGLQLIGWLGRGAGGGKHQHRPACLQANIRLGSSYLRDEQKVRLGPEIARLIGRRKKRSALSKKDDKI